MNASSLKVVNSDRLDEIKEITLPVSLCRGASAAIGQHLFYMGGVAIENGNQPLSTAYHIDMKRGQQQRASVMYVCMYCLLAFRG